MLAEQLTAIGDVQAMFRVYIQNVPNYADLPELSGVRPVAPGEIKLIGDNCGNGWRKVFNVYAKLVFALHLPIHFAGKQVPSWQQWRDQSLLQTDSNSLLVFSPLQLASLEPAKIHIVMGKGWAKNCNLDTQVDWLNNDFAIHKTLPVVICPYFDYRQLSNQKIVFLCDLLKQRFI